MHRLNLSVEKIFKAERQNLKLGCIFVLKKINTHTPPLRFFHLRQKKSLDGKAASYCIIKAFLALIKRIA